VTTRTTNAARLSPGPARLTSAPRAHAIGTLDPPEHGVRRIPSMPVSKRCGNTWHDVQCELPAGHGSAHRAQLGGSLAWWARAGRRPRRAAGGNLVNAARREGGRVMCRSGFGYRVVRRAICQRDMR
jgi:hypothetical protein